MTRKNFVRNTTADETGSVCLLVIMVAMPRSESDYCRKIHP
jgi:hypothetical protein